jgi:DNA helicase-2/ATP-dependent DNA helicase PcrA
VTSPAPQLEGEALAAVLHRGSHLQIIAAAGSGKTEVVSQRVAALLDEGVAARGIVAFTFTERAAVELKHRIARRVEQRLGREAIDLLNGLFVGTIHAYCFRLLQQRVSRYETFDVLDDHQQTGFLSREATRLGIKQLDPAGRNRTFASIAAFLKGVDVVENELLDPADPALGEPFGTVLRDYLATLDRYRLLTYGQQIVRAVEELSQASVAADVHAELEHLIVDEYQDVNPAQEKLIQLLAAPGSGVELCVVGDDDQAIYQWRGSDVGNIVSFASQYPSVATFSITTNRRSRPSIIATANTFASSIPGRIPKTMGEHRPTSTGAPEVVFWHAADEVAEVGWVANLVLDIVDAGVPYRDIAVLVRSRAAYARLLDTFATFDIPVQPGGRTGLFDQPEARALGRLFCWLSGVEWRDPRGAPEVMTLPDLLDELGDSFGLHASARRPFARVLEEWQASIDEERRRADLVGELYVALDELGVRHWRLDDPLHVNRLGTLARFSALLADYESVRRRARPDPEVAGEQVGGQDRGAWYYKNLALHVVNYAQGAYEGFDGEAEVALDAVDVTTVHRAKGLEWPAVFVPSLTAGRFPSRMTGRAQDWPLPRHVFPAERYEGSDADERRLFYVAMTRSRDWLSASRHERVTTKAVAASPYYAELDHLEVEPQDVRLPEIGGGSESADDPIEISFSELAAYLDCGQAYRLRSLIGFQPRLAPELGYGKAVHHVMRAVAEVTRATGVVPSPTTIDDILDASFFLPTANKPAHRALKDAARRLVTRYADEHEADLFRVWETERPFELHLDGVTVVGRADVILDQEGGVPTGLAILDYKTSTAPDSDHGLQLQVYADAGRREGLDVRGAYVHDLKRSDRSSVDITAEAVAVAEETVSAAAVRIRRREYEPVPGQRCRACEVRTVCAVAVR